MLKQQRQIKDVQIKTCPVCKPVLEPSIPLRFWEIDNLFKCPVVGTCLSLSDQKQVLKKSGISSKNKNAFEIHEILVACSETENTLSRRADTMLNRKYGTTAGPLVGLGPEKFLPKFMAAFESGDFKDVLWAAATNRNLPFKTKRKIFGEIHMGMHAQSEDSITMRHTIHRQSLELDRLRKTTREETRQRRTLKKENHRLKQELYELDLRLNSTRKQNEKMASALVYEKQKTHHGELEKKNEVLKKKIAQLMGALEEKDRQAASFQETLHTLESEMARQQERHSQFTQQASEFIKELTNAGQCDASCPSFDLCQKRILIVGGITRMASLYREFIENSGGIFEYHDGYMKKGTKQLEYRLKRADMVLCPVNCNSHAACSVVKNLAKKHKKTLHILSNSSINTISQVVFGNDAESRILN